ncbi:hypothetical protein DDB_G0276017 [Dictyostelium discoideum AX4]|uniref:Putative ZDHHC-type palmitoyltransferase 7 n=1 Tax=Dictyostelium discoideum TaxID=44689 RepID=ZDHC7_DICDI|nr:hypothetical protein DDB_G0276017 [Dictyostelium discoideum AX4]Q552M6.1 RecName: Full=Putative ZDHHC-type palmitoyltransferase 7; AltName: Full=Zinc finger DHHC domain-containing protein 7 [Dictyostelium discoideum]EAL69465.1 hypothetical protein DDB_G0276017 [Dictyostelium discoideum AX4]|eukprot:XP_643386.1 hypothetical protein DDB_G0276017 [Dictyostelium discoideum AX4]
MKLNSNINNNINNSSNSNNNFDAKNIIVDTITPPDPSVEFERKLAKSIFCLVHFIVYCVIIFRKGTILDQAFKDKDYFYLIWTHCVFFFAIGTYFLISSKRPGFVSLSNQNLNNNNNNNGSSNKFILEDSMGCIPQLNINPTPNYSKISNIKRKLKNSSGDITKNQENEDLVPLMEISKNIDEDSINDDTITTTTTTTTTTSTSTIPEISNDDDDNNNENNNDNVNNRNNNNSNGEKEDNDIDKLKNHYFCKKCLVDIPLRTKHCVKCNRCVLKYDHHCVFIGGCVGLNNHKNFLLFLLAESLLLLLGLRIIVTGFVRENSIKEWIFSNIAIIPPTLLIFGGLCMPFALFCFHSFLILTNQSSWEFNKYQRITYLKPFSKRGINPFNKGPWNNLKKFLKGDENPSDWILLSKYEVDQMKKKEENTFNIWNNKYYSCCG